MVRAIQPQSKRSGLNLKIAALALAATLGGCATVHTPDDLGHGPVAEAEVHLDTHSAWHALHFVGHVLEAVFWIHAIRHGGHYHRRHRH